MKITITGSLGNIGKPLTQKLTAAGHQVTVISSNADRQSEIEALGAKAAIGSVNDAAFLESAFTGADAVYTMTPPNLGGQNVIANTVAAGKALAEAITKSGVGRVVMLSSIGADQPSGTGPIAGLYHIEQLFDELENVSVTYLRAGYFYNNFFNDIPLIKGAGITGSNFPGSIQIPLVYPSDIAAAVAEELVKLPEGKNVQYIVSDVKTGEEVAKAFGAAIGKPELPWVEFTDEQALGGMLQAGLPEEIAGLYVEMGSGFRNGSIPADFLQQGAPVNGATKLEQFAQTFAARF